MATVLIIAAFVFVRKQNTRAHKACMVAALVVSSFFLSDWILNQIEVRRGQRFANRSVVFFVIILALAVVVFNLIEYFMAGRIG